MRSKNVIDLAPLPVAVAAWLMVAGQYTTGTTGTAFNLAALVINAASLGALLTHFPSNTANHEPS